MLQALVSRHKACPLLGRPQGHKGAPEPLPPCLLCLLCLAAAQRGLVVNDTIVIRYQIELVVSTGGALSRHTTASKVGRALGSPGCRGVGAGLMQDGQRRGGWSSAGVQRRASLCYHDSPAPTAQLRMLVYSFSCSCRDLPRRATPAHWRGGRPQVPRIAVPPPSLGRELGTLLEAGTGTDVQFDVEGERMPAHKIILQAREELIWREGHLPSLHTGRALAFTRDRGRATLPRGGGCGAGRLKRRGGGRACRRRVTALGGGQGDGCMGSPA